ncbi:MAG: hypothetical protein OQJ76_00145 [Rhodospirillales bacterium]|nr:hypothetical protein [Rhodospirillales bacterium]
MPGKLEFEPSSQKVLAVSNHQALGRALEIMLKAVGFGTIEIVAPVDVCERVGKMKKKPDFILFTQDYLMSPMQEKLAAGCPCTGKNTCEKALIVMLLRQQQSESVITSKEMGFDDIVFADASLQKMYGIIEKVYLRHQSL